MIHIAAGTDTYGRVKKISGTPIVTKFAMFQMLPIYPLQSFYFSRSAPSETLWVPFVVSSRSAKIVGVPLASLDFMSVIMAYVRAIFAACTVMGFIPVFMDVLVGGRPQDDFGTALTFISRTMFCTGVIGGLLTYAIPLTRHRERDIRQHCAELIGLSADPARVTSEMSLAIVDYAEKNRASEKNSRAQLIYQLVVTRAKIAQGTSRREMESKTDELLARLRSA